jgi:hypothetical protein
LDGKNLSMTVLAPGVPVGEAERLQKRANEGKLYFTA